MSGKQKQAETCSMINDIHITT